MATSEQRMLLRFILVTHIFLFYVDDRCAVKAWVLLKLSVDKHRSLNVAVSAN